MKKKSLTEAIADLEKAAGGKMNETLQSLQPHLDELKKKAEEEFDKQKTAAEKKLQEEPWLFVGLVGLVAFILGWLLGSRKR